MSESNKFLESKGKLTSLLPMPITWQETLSLIRNMPYGRNSSRYDPSLVITEMKGTCSSKHAVIKMIADENHIQDVKLILCLYKMDGVNTPGIGKVLMENKISYIPEAHCYLNIDGVKHDLINPTSDIARIEDAVLEEIEISADQVAEFKVEFHKSFVKKWIEQSNIDYTFMEVWEIREKCIEALSSEKTKD